MTQGGLSALHPDGSGAQSLYFIFISSYNGDSEALPPVKLDPFSVVDGNILHVTGNICSEPLQETRTRTEHHWSNRCRTQRSITH